MNEACLSLATAWLYAARSPSHSAHANTIHDPIFGHAFQISVACNFPAALLDYSGSQVAQLKTALEQALASIKGQHLNKILIDPSDEALAQWVAQQLHAFCPVRVTVQSTPWQGADYFPAPFYTHGTQTLAQGSTQVWRRYRFLSAHQLPHVPLGHKCGRMHGHSFEAVLHLGLQAKNSSQEAWKKIDEAWAPLHFVLHYQTLNHIQGLENPTSERLSAWIFDQLQSTLPTLMAVTVDETPTSGAYFDGQHYRIWKDFSFDSATQWPHAPADSPLHQIHGYTYLLRLGLSAPLDEVMGWAKDYGDVKLIFQPLLNDIDHHPLYEICAPFDGDSASLARWVATRAQAQLPEIDHLVIYENEGCGSWLSLRQERPSLPMGVRP